MKFIELTNACYRPSGKVQMFNLDRLITLTQDMGSTILDFGGNEYYRVLETEEQIKRIIKREQGIIDE